MKIRCFLFVFLFSVTFYSCVSRPNIAPSPLATAITKGDIESVKKLLDHGADPNEFSVAFTSKATVIFYETPATIAITGTSDTIILNLLLQHGANLNLYDSNSIMPEPPLVNAIVLTNVQTVSYLLRHGANPNVANGYPLTSAIEDRNYFPQKSHKIADRIKYDSIITLLLNSGASPILIDDQGYAPVHRAAMECDSVSMEAFLSNAQASLTVKDPDGKTIKDLASDCPSIMALIRKYEK